LYLNPSGELVQFAEILRLSHPARSVACTLWPELDHYSNFRFCGQDCSDDTTSILHNLKKIATKRTNVQCPLSYLSTTSMRIKKT
jgi:hypothetical protein